MSEGRQVCKEARNEIFLSQLSTETDVSFGFTDFNFAKWVKKCKLET